MSAGSGVTETMLRFGYPQFTVAEYPHWVVLLRDRQATLGALVVACREEATAFGDVTSAAFGELGQVVPEIEGTLLRVFRYDKINYLMLMMVDPHVHFHVIPRYAAAREFDGVTFVDPAWPRPPDLGHANEIGEPARNALLRHLREAWPRGSATVPGASEPSPSR